MASMKRPLVVTDSSDRVEELVREAGELAADAGVPLTVLTVVTQDEYENDAKILGKIADVEGSTTNPTPDAYAEQVAQTAVSDLLLEFDLDTETVGRSVPEDDDRADAILDVAAENDCDYIFLLGRRRSPTGKAIFGDTAQSVVLNFDQYVVTMTE